MRKKDEEKNWKEENRFSKWGDHFERDAGGDDETCDGTTKGFKKGEISKSKFIEKTRVLIDDEKNKILEMSLSAWVPTLLLLQSEIVFFFFSTSKK